MKVLLLPLALMVATVAPTADPATPAENAALMTNAGFRVARLDLAPETYGNCLECERCSVTYRHKNIESQPIIGYASTHMYCVDGLSCNGHPICQIGGLSIPDDDARTSFARQVFEADGRGVVMLLRAHRDAAYVNLPRGAVQIHGCSNVIAMSIQLRPEQMAAVQAALMSAE